MSGEGWERATSVLGEVGERFREGGIPDLGWVEHVASFEGFNSAPTHVNTVAD